MEPSDSEVTDDGQTSTQIMSETIASANDESPLVVSSTEEIFQESSSEEVKEADVPTVAPVGFGEAISRGFSNYFVFKGRASRREYWWWVLFTVLVSFIPFGGFVTFIPSLAVSVRRLHDKGKSAEKFIWMCALQFGALCLMFIGVFSSTIWFISAIPVFIAIWIWWAAEMSDDGQEGTNEYGPDPRSTPRS